MIPSKQTYVGAGNGYERKRRAKRICSSLEAPVGARWAGQSATCCIKHHNGIQTLEWRPR
jgi:hypothetical protein